MNTTSKQRLQDKREFVVFLRERDRRAEQDPDTMLESDLDKEIEFRQNPKRYETNNSVLQEIKEVLLKMAKKDSTRTTPIPFTE